MLLSSLPISLLLLVSPVWGADSLSSSGSDSVSASETVSASASVVLSSASSASSSSGANLSSTSTASYPSLSGYSTCVDTCLDSAVANAGCDSVVEVDCFCGSNSTVFIGNLTSCMASNCPASLSTAESLAERFCALASTSTSLSFATTSLSASTSSAFTSSATSTSSIAASSVTSASSTSSSANTADTSTSTSTTSAADRAQVAFAFVVGAAAALVGIALGC